MASAYFNHLDIYGQQVAKNVHVHNSEHVHSWYAPAAWYAPEAGIAQTQDTFVQEDQNNSHNGHCYVENASCPPGSVPERQLSTGNCRPRTLLGCHDYTGFDCHRSSCNHGMAAVPHFYGGGTSGNGEHAPISPMGSSGGSAGSSPDTSEQHVVTHVRPPPARSPYEWIKKNGYQSHPNPGKTRTKDKYRVVYTDHQRMELEKEFNLVNRYITIRRKTELAHALGLSERQVKIWFQNRRAKERKQNKKRVEEKYVVML